MNPRRNYEYKIGFCTGTKGEQEYILVGIRRWEDIDTITEILVDEFDANVQDIFDGIWARDVTLKIGDEVFMLIYHEDIGIYFTSINSPGEKIQALEI